MDEIQAWRDMMLIAGVAVLIGTLVSQIQSSIELGSIRRELEKLNRKK